MAWPKDGVAAGDLEGAARGGVGVLVATKGGVDAPRVEAVEDSDGGTTPAPCCADVWPAALVNWPPVSSRPTDSSSSSPSSSLSSSEAPAFADNVAKLSLGTEDGR